MQVKRFIVALCSLMMVVMAAGCGEEKPQIPANETVEAIAALYAYGDTTNAVKTGDSEEEIHKAGDVINESALKLFESLNVMGSTKQELANYLLNSINESMNIQTKIKSESGSEAVVELTYNPIDGKNFERMLSTDPQFQQVMEARAMIEAAGQDVQMDSDYNDAIKAVFEQIFDDMPIKDPKTIEVKCKIVKGADGKPFWQPEDLNALAEEFSLSDFGN